MGESAAKRRKNEEGRKAKKATAMIVAEKDEEEMELEGMDLWDKVEKNLGSKDLTPMDDDEEPAEDNQLFVIDKRKARVYEDVDGQRRKRLRMQFEKLHPTPSWAKPKRKRTGDGSDDDDESSYAAAAVFRSSSSLIRKSTARSFPSVNVDVHRVRDANQMEPSSAVVQACRFHPAAPILMTAGLDHMLRLFHIDGKLNPKVQGVYFKDLPILSADFTPDGRQVIVSGRRKHFYVYDIDAGMGRDEESFERHVASPCGQFIAFLGLSRTTKQWIANLKMNGSDGKYLYSIGGDGEIYQWDLASRQCLHRFFDEGSVKSATLAISPDNSLIATGSSTGIVNVYNLNSALQTERPTPLKTYMNLTTPITALRFHPSSQALVFASKLKKDSMRISHTKSMSVFSNWPTAATPLGYVNALDWSPEEGKALLYRFSAFDGC
ncbi:WD40-repeat-containing domain protein [Chytridium lagenaria]|nr:WD40-repeat-containing domain protein [Chytridium lagenaria]